MQKIPTLFKKDPNDLSRVINELQCDWVNDVGVRATRKWDGTAASVINGKLYKRYDVKKGRQVPDGAIPCQEPDEITGHWPHWILVDRFNPTDKWMYVALADYTALEDGTYEFCGPKVNGNNEKFTKHLFLKHGAETVLFLTDFEDLKEFLSGEDIEGIVFHHPDGRMCKIRKSDFGIKR